MTELLEPLLNKLKISLEDSEKLNYYDITSTISEIYQLVHQYPNLCLLYENDLNEVKEILIKMQNKLLKHKLEIKMQIENLNLSCKALKSYHENIINSLKG